jgi:hypothetical protein
VAHVGWVRAGQVPVRTPAAYHYRYLKHQTNCGLMSLGTPLLACTKQISRLTSTNCTHPSIHPLLPIVCMSGSAPKRRRRSQECHEEENCRSSYKDDDVQATSAAAFQKGRIIIQKWKQGSTGTQRRDSDARMGMVTDKSHDALGDMLTG